MVDSELKELRELKAKLVEKVYELRDQLEGNENNSPEIRFEKFLTKFSQETKNSVRPISVEKDTARLCNVSESIIGVQFKDVEKNWIRENIYRYEAKGVTKALKFAMDVTVDVEENEFTICDINCHFVNLDNCYTLEITQWIQRFAQEKNFSRLISGISDYSDQSVIRAKILRSLESKDYISLDMCRNDGGGIYVYVHPPGDEERIFFKFLWSTEFVDRSWRIEHIFAINPVEAGEEFVKANEDLLQGFCKIGLRKDDLENLWSQLCEAIDNV